MTLLETFVSCDWGTSNFRLRLIDAKTLRVISEHSTAVGVKKLYEAFQQSDKKISQTAYFVAYLKQEIKQLSIAKESIPTIIASGMASASIGMLELPYVAMPLNFKGDNLYSRVISEDGLHIILVSGAKTTSDVMRGEEIQAIGLSKFLPNDSEGILLLPGTHSKHIQFKKGVYTSFVTYMTGELFDILSKNSILKNSLLKTDWDNKFEAVFLEGVQKGLHNQHLASLFSIRANDLLGGKTHEENFYFLSGLLIGGELSYLKNSQEEIYIATTGVLYKLYKLALQQIDKAITYFDADKIDTALLEGHKKIVESYV